MERSFGAYQLGEPLGTLPVGELVEASHSARSEPLALLLLDGRLAGDHRFRGLVRLEMARAGGLRQPGIARTVEISEHSGALAVVYERPAGSVSLATTLASERALGQETALGIVRRLADALDAAHTRRIVHGMVGTSSVLIGADGAAALVGAGLLAAIDEAGLHDFILERADQATIAPEQATGPAAVTSADGYALAVLAEQLLGEHTTEAVQVLHRQQSSSPEQRYPSCAAFAAALTDALSSGSSAVSPTSPDSPASDARTADAAPGEPVSMPPASAPAPMSSPLPPPTPSYASEPPAAELAPPWTPPPPTWTPPPAWGPPAPSWTDEPPTPTPMSASEQASTTLPETAPSTIPPAVPTPSAAPPPSDTPQTSAVTPTSAPPSYAQAPDRQSSRPEAQSQAPVSSSSPSSDLLPAWLRDSLDPPSARRRTTTGSPQPGASLEASRGEPTAVPARPDAVDERSRWRDSQPQLPTVERGPATPAMLAFQKATGGADLGTALVLAVTSRVSFLDQMVAKYAPDGRIGPVPLGVAVGGALVVLLLLLRQPAPAAIFVVLILGLYVLPPVLRTIVGAEAQPAQAVRVTGTVSVRKRMVGMNWDIFELDIEDGLPLSLPASGYRRLTSIGTPITIERPTMYGPEQVTIAHELHDVTITYLEPGRALLDVRDANGAVIHRHPEYAGEPGDRTSLDTPSGELGENGTLGTSACERPDSTPTWKPTPYGQRIVLPMPHTLTADLHAGFKSAALRAGIVNGVPLLVLLVTFITGDFGFFVLILGVMFFMFVGAGLLTRAMKLRKAQESDTIVQVAGRLQIRQLEETSSKGKKTHQYFVRLDDGAELRVEQALYDKLARLGRQLEMGERPSIWERLTQNQETIRAYEVQGPTATYEPSSQLLLEIVDAADNLLYRDSAIRPLDIGKPPAR